MIHTDSIEKQLELITSQPRSEVLEAYRPLVGLVAKHYPNIENATELGMHGLERAIPAYLKRFEKEKASYKFSTYATYFIKRAIENSASGA